MSDYFKFFRFKHQMTPEIIQGGFWIMILVLVVGNLYVLGNGGDPLGSMLSLVLVGLLARFVCELLVILIRIRNSLAVIEKNSAEN